MFDKVLMARYFKLEKVEAETCCWGIQYQYTGIRLAVNGCDPEGISLSINLSICLSVYASITLSIYLYFIYMLYPWLHQ